MLGTPRSTRSVVPVVAFAAHAVFWIASVARAADAPPRPGVVSFKHDVAPLLVNRCQGCHGPEKVKGGYRLDSFADLVKPGASKSAPVAAGKPSESELFRLVVTPDADERMPKKGDRLPDADVRALRLWIEQGAAFDGPDASTPLAALLAERPFPDPPRAYRRPAPVAALAFRPDGKEVAVGGYHEVIVRDPADGTLLRRLKNLPQRIQGLAWSPDGALLAVAGGTPGALGEVRLIDPAGAPAGPSPADVPAAAPRGKVLDRLADVAFAVRFSPDGSRLAAGGADNAVRVYDVSRGLADGGAGCKRLLLIEQHADWVTDVAFSPDGSRLASASRDKSCRIFDARTGAMEAAYLDHEEPVSAAAWAPDGAAVYSAGRDGKIHLWSAKDGKKQAEIGGFNADVSRLELVGGMVFSACSDGRVRQHTQARPPLWVRDFVLGPEWAYALSVNPKTMQLAAAGFDGRVRVWALDDGRQVSHFSAAPGDENAK